MTIDTPLKKLVFEPHKPLSIHSDDVEQNAERLRMVVAEVILNDLDRVTEACVKLNDAYVNARLNEFEENVANSYLLGYYLIKRELIQMKSEKKSNHLVNPNKKTPEISLLHPDQQDQVPYKYFAGFLPKIRTGLMVSNSMLEGIKSVYEMYKEARNDGNVAMVIEIPADRNGKPLDSFMKPIEHFLQTNDLRPDKDPC